MAPLVQVEVRSDIKRMLWQSPKFLLGPLTWPSKHGRLFQGLIIVMHVNEQGTPCESHKGVGLSHDGNNKLESCDKRESKVKTCKSFN
jgi:hypothetical protein